MNNITYLCLTICLSFFTVFTESASLYASNDIQRVRLGFTTPTGYTRHLLLGFTPNNAATDDFDYGYDALCIENLPNDLNWRIGDKNCVIQGVGAFNTHKVYPFRMFLTNSGTVQIALTGLENFSSAIDVFIYDAQLQTFSQISDAPFITDMTGGEYINRFFITFSNEYNIVNYAVQAFQEQLSTIEHHTDTAIIKHYQSSNTVHIQSSQNIRHIRLFDVTGKLLFEQQAHSLAHTLNLNEFGLTTPHMIVQVQTDSGIYNHRIVR